VILRGDCVEQMRELDEASVDAIVTDPPYNLGFMSRPWDIQHDHEPWSREAFRILKPGGHLLAFGGTRTYHRLACAVEDAGFEIRDSLIWIYGSGFPKSLDVSKAIDKANGRKFEDRYALGRHIKERRQAADFTQAEVNGWFGYRDGCQHWERQDPSGARVPTLADWEVLVERLGLSDAFLPLVERAEAEREVTGRDGRQAASSWLGTQDGETSTWGMGEWDKRDAPATPEAQQWQGWGTALKPAHEPIVVARKPLSGTVAANVLEHGTGALNIDGCRVGTERITTQGYRNRNPGLHTQRKGCMFRAGADYESTQHAGRWPANLALSHLPECERVGTRKVRATTQSTTRVNPLGMMNDDGWEPQKNDRPATVNANPDGTETIPKWACVPGCPVAELDRQSGESGGGFATRGASSRIYGGGKGFTEATGEEVGYGDTGGASRYFYTAKASRAERSAGLPEGERNGHPTVKALDLMRWLVRLVTPPGGTVCDPFLGSGTTGIAAHLEGFDFIGIEREAEYAEIAKARIEWWSQFPAGTELDAALGLNARETVVRESGQLGLLDGEAA
jgi:DNA modification methylase